MLASQHMRQLRPSLARRGYYVLLTFPIALTGERAMSKLKEEAPELLFDENEMLKWGYIWRIGTKTRKQTAADDNNGSADDVAVEAAVAAASAGITPLTAAAAGLPAKWAEEVSEDEKHPSAFNKKQGMDFGMVFDRAVGAAVASMLGDIPIVDFARSNALKKARAATWVQHIKDVRDAAKAAGVKVPKIKDVIVPEIDIGIEWTTKELLPPIASCVEVGPARIIGGIRPQNFDVAYRPDGPRIVYDSKTLNDAGSIPKNWQNMVNDLGTEATTVHTRFPYAIVAFIVAVPKPAIRDTQLSDLIRTLERLATREVVIDQAHLAEAIAFVVWDPETGKIDTEVPGAASCLHVSKFMSKIHRCYVERYKGLPPHDK